MGPSQTPATLSESTGSSQVKPAPPAPDLTRGGAGLGLLCGLFAQYCTASQAQKAQATAEVSLTLQQRRLPFLAIAVHPPTAGIALETWFRHEPHSSRCNSRPPCCHDQRRKIDGSNASAPSDAVFLSGLFLTGRDRPECREPALNATMIRHMLTASHSAGMQHTHTKASLRHTVPLGKFVPWWDATPEISRVHLDNWSTGAHQVTISRYPDSRDNPNHPNGT